MDLSALLPVGGLALIAGLWTQIKALAARFRSIFITKVTFGGYISRPINRYCWDTCKRSPFGDRQYAAQNTYVRPLSTSQMVAYEEPSNQPWVFWKGNVPFMLGGVPNTRDGSTSPLATDGIITMTFIRGTINIDDFVQKAVAGYNDFRAGKGKSASNRFRVQRIVGRGSKASRMGGSENSKGSSPTGQEVATDDSFPTGAERLIGWKPEDIGQPCPPDPLSHIIVPEALKSAINEFKRWLDSKDWFAARDIPWRRGWQMTGKPGTGKSVLARTLAQVGNMPVYAFDLATLSNEEFHDAWANMLQSAPCMALFEDFDAVFHGRDNILGEMGGGLTFDCILNAMSGVERADGVFVIVTTNHPEHIDPAMGVSVDGATMSSRPGRLDRIVEVPPFDTDACRALVGKILRDWPEVIEDKVKEADGFTAAQVTDLCVRYAIARFWNEPVEAVGAPLPDVEEVDPFGVDVFLKAREVEGSIKRNHDGKLPSGPRAYIGLTGDGREKWLAEDGRPDLTGKTKRADFFGYNADPAGKK